MKIIQVEIPSPKHWLFRWKMVDTKRQLDTVAFINFFHFQSKN